MSFTTDLPPQSVEYIQYDGEKMVVQMSTNDIVSKKDDIRAKIEAAIKEIEEQKEQAEILFGHALGYEYIRTYKKCLDIIRKHIGEAE